MLTFRNRATAANKDGDQFYFYELFDNVRSMGYVIFLNELLI